MERSIDDPIKVVGEDTHVAIFAEGHVGDEVHGFAGCNDRFALGGGEDVHGHAETWYGGVGVVCYRWADRCQRDGIGECSIEDGGVVVWWLALRAGGCLDDTQGRGRFRGFVEDGFVENRCIDFEGW